jgi:Zn-dependent peptidase ImmA (M78 family)
MAMIGERLRQARELNKWTQEELAAQVGVTQSAIALIERDALVPRDEVVVAISHATGFPREFFDLPIASDFPLGSLVYRKFTRMRADHKRQSHRLAQQAYELSQFLLSRLKPVPVTLPRGLRETPATSAQIVRNALGIDPVTPIKTLMHRVEKAGVRVFLLPEEIPDLDAFSAWVDDVPVVVLNANKPGDRQNFNLAHEIGHLTMHYPLTFGQDGIEEEANEFAGELLLPEVSIREELVPPVTLALVAELKARWRVSMQALLYRARELAIVTERQYKYLRMQMAKNDWVQVEPVPIEPDRPRGLRKMAEVAYGSQLNYRKIAKDAGRPPFLVSRIIEASATREGVDVSPGRLIDFRERAN